MQPVIILITASIKLQKRAVRLGQFHGLKLKISRLQYTKAEHKAYQNKVLYLS